MEVYHRCYLHLRSTRLGQPPPPSPLHPNQEGDTSICERTSGLMAESVYGGDIQSISTDH